MPVALHPSCISRYVLKADRELPEGQHTRFKIRALDPNKYYELLRDSMAIRDAIQREAPALVQVQTVEPAEENDAQMRAAAPESLEWTAAYSAHILKMLNAGLTGWENFKDADGAQVPFVRDEDGTISAESLSRLTWWHVVEIAEAVLTENQAPAALKGN